jgi:hypothetical protein
MGATTKADIQNQILLKLSDLSEGQAVMKSQLVAMQEALVANTKLLRGNGVPGMVTQIALLQDDIQELKAAIPAEAECRKDMKAVKSRVESYPTYFWLLRNKTKSTVLSTIAVFFVTFVLVSPLVDHGLFAALLTWVGVPAAVVKTIVGG